MCCFFLRGVGEFGINGRGEFVVVSSEEGEVVNVCSEEDVVVSSEEGEVVNICSEEDVVISSEEGIVVVAYSQILSFRIIDMPYNTTQSSLLAQMMVIILNFTNIIYSQFHLLSLQL